MSRILQLICLCFAFVIAGCGQKGALMLPNDEHQTTSERTSELLAPQDIMRKHAEDEQEAKKQHNNNW